MNKKHSELHSIRHTYLNFPLIFALLFISTSFIGCSDDDDNDWQKTNTNGRPSKITSEDGSINYFYYKNNQLIKQFTKNSSVTEYTYEKNELTKRYSYMTDLDIQDGSGDSTFERKGNIITVKNSGEPGGNFHFVQEIELGTNELPIKITEKGYKYDGDTHPEPELVLYYTILTYDSSGKTLIKKEIYEVKSDKKVATYTYEYDNNKGMISNNGLPAWYNIYMSTDLYSFMYLCTTNNILKINMDDARYNKSVRSAAFTYEYNEAKYPVRVSASIDEVSIKQSINY